jgi:hypothetical protein
VGLWLTIVGYRSNFYFTSAANSNSVEDWTACVFQHYNGKDDQSLLTACGAKAEHHTSFGLATWFLLCISGHSIFISLIYLPAVYESYFFSLPKMMQYEWQHRWKFRVVGLMSRSSIPSFNRGRSQSTLPKRASAPASQPSRKVEDSHQGVEGLREGLRRGSPVETPQRLMPAALSSSVSNSKRSWLIPLQRGKSAASVLPWVAMDPMARALNELTGDKVSPTGASAPAPVHSQKTPVSLGQVEAIAAPPLLGLRMRETPQVVSDSLKIGSQQEVSPRMDSYSNNTSKRPPHQ